MNRRLEYRGSYLGYVSGKGLAWIAVYERIFE